MITEFFKPASVEEAVSIKKEHPGSMYYGGGTSINYPPSGIAARCVVGLEKLGLDTIESKRDALVIGSMVTIQEMIDDPAVFPALKEAASFIYSRNIRNIATIGGNVGAKQRDSALIPALIALSARVETGEKGVISVEDYAGGAEDSLICAIHVPKKPGNCGVKKLSRSAGSIPILQAAVYIHGTWDKVNEAVVAVSGIGPRVIRLPEIENGLKAGVYKDKDELGKAVAQVVTPESDFRGSAEYKKYSTGIAVADCAATCMGRG